MVVLFSINSYLTKSRGKKAGQSLHPPHAPSPTKPTTQNPVGRTNHELHIDLRPSSPPSYQIYYSYQHNSCAYYSIHLIMPRNMQTLGLLQVRGRLAGGRTPHTRPNILRHDDATMRFLSLFHTSPSIPPIAIKLCASLRYCTSVECVLDLGHNHLSFGFIPSPHNAHFRRHALVDLGQISPKLNNVPDRNNKPTVAAVQIGLKKQ